MAGVWRACQIRRHSKKGLVSEALAVQRISVNSVPILPPIGDEFGSKTCLNCFQFCVNFLACLAVTHTHLIIIDDKALRCAKIDGLSEPFPRHVENRPILHPIQPHNSVPRMRKPLRPITGGLDLLTLA